MTGQKEKKTAKKIRFIPWIEHMEQGIAGIVFFHPFLISGFKLLVIFPLLVILLKQIALFDAERWIVIALFIIFLLFDYIDNTVLRYRDTGIRGGAVIDRITDFPLLLVLVFFCIDMIPLPLLLAKPVLEALMIVLCLAGRGSAESRVRTGVHFSTLLVLFLLSQGWAPWFITTEFVVYLLLLDIVFLTVFVLFNLNILKKNYIADALSGANLLCGVFSMVFAYRNRFDISLLFLMLGAVFDGFDGAAARKFGGTRWGVYSDDIADAVNYGIAPGVALYFFLEGVEGAVVGFCYSFFTLSRLVFFTLNKAYGDPEYFCGVPSTVGALITLCSMIIFSQRPVIVGFMIGVACIQMVSFDTHYRHLGRALSCNRRIIYGIPPFVIALLAGYIFWGMDLPVAVILAASLIYGFLPTFLRFVDLIGKKARPG